MSKSLPTTMRAMVYDRYGGPEVLQQRELPLPSRSAHELLIEVHASSVNPLDYRMRHGQLRWLVPGGFPRIPGYDVAGVVVGCPAQGPFAEGDRVLAYLNHVRGGALADYAVCGLHAAARIPPSLSFAEAAALPLAGSTALQALRDHGRLAAGQRVLVLGASGGVGCFAVQIAHALGAQVDAVASGRNHALCQSLGAQRCFDYQREDYAAAGSAWHLIFDAAGKSGFRHARHALTTPGHYVTTEPNGTTLLQTLLTKPFSQRCTAMLALPRAADLQTLVDMVERQALRVLLDSTHAFSAAAAAHQRIESGVDHGKVVIIHRDPSPHNSSAD